MLTVWTPKKRTPLVSSLRSMGYPFMIFWQSLKYQTKTLFPGAVVSFPHDYHTIISPLDTTYLILQYYSMLSLVLGKTTDAFSPRVAYIALFNTMKIIYSVLVNFKLISQYLQSKYAVSRNLAHLVIFNVKMPIHFNF